MGVTKFLAVDNGSTDGSLDFLLSQPDVHLWQTAMSFNESNFDSAWFEILLSKYGLGHWTLMLDVDEILMFPGSEERTLSEFSQSVETRGKVAASGLMLDMYDDSHVSITHYRRGDDFLSHCPYFDRTTHHAEYPNSGPFNNQTFYFGGARKGVFGNSAEYLVSKVPLLKYQQDTILAGGQHWTNQPAVRIAHAACSVLHFKYFSSLLDCSQREATREEHSEGGRQYKAYAAGFDTDRYLNFYDPSESLAFKGGSQLVELGIIDSIWAQGQPSGRPISIADQQEHESASPFWSVMITVYDRLHLLERTLRSVLAQDTSDMQIEIVADHAGPVVTAGLHELVQSIPGAANQVVVTVLDSRVGQPHIFNECIERSRGKWVHILHDDDWVRPDFYSALREGIETNAEVGAAFTRHDLTNGDSEVTWTSWMERESPGLIDSWLDRIAVECRVQFSAMVVRRDVYETLGGFCDGIGSAFDWEMWQRVAVNTPVWFEPRTLAVISRDGTAETDLLVTNGRQITDSVTVIERSRTYLPADKAAHLTRMARERFALYGLDLAMTQIKAGQSQAALCGIREALRASDSRQVLAKLDSLLAQVDSP